MTNGWLSTQNPTQARKPASKIWLIVSQSCDPLSGRRRSSVRFVRFIFHPCVRRDPVRGSHDWETINQILDAGFLACVGFCVDSQPFVIPTLYGRDGERLYLHGSAASRMLRELEAGVPACATVTLVDGLVLSRSAFDHSMNYR